MSPQSLIASPDLTMPPKAHRPPPGVKRAPSTPVSKLTSWTGPATEETGSTSSLTNQPAAAVPWGSSSESLAGEVDLMEDSGMATSERCSYLRYLPTKEKFKNVIVEVKDTCLTTIADRVESLEEAHDSTRHFASQLQQNAFIHTKALKETLPSGRPGKQRQR